MVRISDGIRYLEGSTEILVVAPHGPLINGFYQNDIRTGVIAEELHRLLGCGAIINDRFFKPKGVVRKDAARYFLDLFRIDHSRKVVGYLDMIRAAVSDEHRTLVVWLHGIADDVALDQAALHRNHGLYEGTDNGLHALIGYGQGGDPKTGEERDNLTARPATVERLCARLTAGGMTTVPTWDRGPNFRGRDGKRLNQWFLQLGYSLDRVESVQLEMREQGFRETDENAMRTARILAMALTA